MVSAFSEDPLLAQVFLIEYVASEEIMAQIVSADPRPSAFSEVRDRQTDDEVLEGFIAAGENGQPMPAIPEMSEVWSAWADALTLIQLGQEAPDVAFQNAASQIRTTISGEEAQATPEEEAEEEPAEEEQEESSDEEAMVEGGLVIWAHEAIAPPLQEIAVSFTDEFELPVTVQQVAFGEIRDKFQVAAPAGEGPDIIIGAHDWLGELVINGLLSPIDLGDKEAEFVELALSAFTYDATLYGMPTQTENVALVRNSSLVPDAPESWDDVMATCEALADRIELCFALQQGDPYHFYGIQSSFGGAVFGRDSAGSYDPTQVELDSEGSIAAASFMKDMIDAGYIQAERDNEISNALFDEGQAAFMITGPWAIGSPGEAAVPYALSAIPEGSQAAAPFLAVQGFMVSAFSEYPLLAQLFLTEYVASQEIMTQIVSADPRPSAFSAVRSRQADDEVLQGFIAAGENGQPMAAIPEMSAVWPAWADALTLIQQGQEEPDVAFQNAAEQIRSTIAEGQ
jgi:maltose-binding protein MalE